VTESKYILSEFGNSVSDNERSISYRTVQSDAEEIVDEYYQQKGYEVVGLDSDVESGTLISNKSVPSDLNELLKDDLREHHDLSPLEAEYPLSFIGSKPGVPDFIVYKELENGRVEYSFVEVKTTGTGLNQNQLFWISKLDHLAYKITYVFESPG